MCYSTMWTSDLVLNLSKAKFKHTSCDLEDGLTWVEKLSHPLSHNLYAYLDMARIKVLKLVLFKRYFYSASPFYEK